MLKKIKKHYGESMSQLCRDLFPNLIEDDVLFNLLTSKFQQQKSLCADIVEQGKESEFKNYIYSLIDVEQETSVAVTKTPKTLMLEAGYNLHECKTEKEIQAFKKHYAKSEELCTFNNNRLNSCHVFFAIKTNVDEIKRKDYENPQRQDDYGTSVISIQFAKGNVNYLSIKNRYNHKVNNPDNTFNNNLDNIIDGLTESFKNEYNFNFTTNKNKFELLGYTFADKFYKFNYEINNIYYCNNNVIIDNGVVTEYDKSKYLIVDYFIINLQEKTVSLYDSSLKDDFVNCFEDIQNIEIVNSLNNKVIKLDDNTITIDNNGRIIELDMPLLETVGNNFLPSNEALTNFTAPLLKTVGVKFLFFNRALTIFTAPLLETVGGDFLFNNKALTNFTAPLL